MGEWAAKRFWSESAVVGAQDGFRVELDGRGVKTPAKAALILPTRAMAEAVAQEWDMQEGRIDPLSMPVTRSANAAIDKVRIQHAEVADMLAAYGDTDLVCYRTAHPQALANRQAQAWDPVLDWAAATLDARLTAVQGVVHTPQPAQALAVLSDRVHALDPFQLAAFHDLVSLSGSLLLGFATALDWRDADEIWHLSRIDEHWQEDQWGSDDEATAHAELKRQSFLHAKRFFDLST
ncbi:ATPase [Ruegeria sp. 2012CJ41-6]|uniref:ATPase n=1 Tax=Ruegeria spongiae TaxID=2942209 RepID=A0ABT0Q178_9RHOB|nr:ATP12 family protein [Ruegeria spongiae]MCL6283590.1 ATPase [Ruegeria spongiae]